MSRRRDKRFYRDKRHIPKHGATGDSEDVKVNISKIDVESIDNMKGELTEEIQGRGEDIYNSLSRSYPDKRDSYKIMPEMDGKDLQWVNDYDMEVNEDGFKLVSNEDKIVDLTKRSLEELVELNEVTSDLKREIDITDK